MQARNIFQEWRYRHNPNSANQPLQARYNPSRAKMREAWPDQCDPGELKNIAIFDRHTQYEHNHTRTKAFIPEYCFVFTIATVALSIFYDKNHKPLIIGALAAASTYFYCQSCSTDKKIYKSLGDLMIERLASEPSQFYKIPQQDLADYINIFIKVPRQPHPEPNKFMPLFCVLSVVATTVVAALYHKQGKSLIIGALSVASMYSLCNSFVKNTYQPPVDPSVDNFLSNPDVQLSKQDKQHIANYIKDHNQSYNRC